MSSMTSKLGRFFAALYIVLCLSVVSATSGPLRGTITGTITDDRAAPVVGAHIVLSPSAVTRTIAEAASDRSGNFTFPDLLPGAYRVWITAPQETDLIGDEVARSSPVVEVAPGQITRVSRVLQAGGRIDITLRKGQATWFDDCPCTFVLRRGPTTLPVEPRLGDMRFVFRGLPPADDYTVRFEADGHAFQESGSLGVVRDEVTQVSFAYDPDDQTGITGIFRMSDGTPLAGRFIFLRRAATDASAPPLGRSKTDSLGHFRIVGLSPGAYVLDVVGASSLGQATVVEGSITTVELVWNSPELSRSGRDGGPAWLGVWASLSSLFRVPIAHAASPPPPAWPWVKPPRILECGKGPVAPSSALYLRVLPGIIEGITTGISCLEPKAPKRAKKLKDLVDPDLLVFKQLRTKTLSFEFNCPPAGNECAGSPSVPLQTLIVFIPEALTAPSVCGCFPSIVFHELLHVTSTGILECPTYRCTKECFSCAQDVPREPIANAGGGKEDCAKYPRCCDA